jgi:hypothetical protein
MRPKIPNHFPLFMILTLTVAPLSSLIGCSPPLPFYPKVVAADAKILPTCKYLGEVTGDSGEYIPSLTRSQALSDEIQMQSAKARALQEASDLGATHVAWEGDLQKGYATTIRARAYKCKKE